MSADRANAVDDGRTTVSEDAAWVVVETTWPADELRRFVDDVPRLLRINPQLVFERLDAEGDERLRLVARNLSNDGTVDVGIVIRRSTNGVALLFESGIKAATRIEIEAGLGGARLRITDDYGRLGLDERRARTAEVDRSLHAWGVELHRYLARWKCWSWLPPWRCYMERVWLRMTPAARRITRLIWVISALELAAFVVVVAIWQLS